MPSHAVSSLCETHTWPRLRTHLLIAPLAASLLALSACGDGGGAVLTPGDDDDDPPPPSCTGANCGEVVIALTDADGDFLSYTVDVVSIELEEAGGDTVEVLPTSQRVDFAELADVSEIVSVADIPTGTYERLTVRLDYEEAAVSVEVDGVPTDAAVVNVNADPVGEVEVTIELDEANQVTVTPSTPALLQLDFDLEASHEVNLGTTPVTVTAEPFVVAMVEPVDTREFRARGPLVSVNETNDEYVVELRPFYHQDAEHGEFTIDTTVDTTCEVDGDEFEGADCITELAALANGTPTVAHGEYDVDAGAFTADRVLAGESVPGVEFDTAIGVVVARNLNVLTVRGGTVVRTDGEVVFARGDIEVSVDSSTIVTRDGGSASLLDIDAISVGQRIQAFGEASTSDVSPTLDATDGLVRLHPTQLTGVVENVVTGVLTLDLFSIDGRDPQFFDFDGTGTSSLTTANPESYEVATGALDIDNFELGEGAGAFGFVEPFGEAPPDFRARTLVDFERLRALLGIGWGFNGTEAPFLSMGSSGFVIDVANIDLGARQFLEIGPQVFDITSDLPEPITVEPDESGTQLYAVAQGLEVQVFSDFADFAAQVNSLLNGANMRSFTARGTFQVSTTTLEANYVAVSFVGT